MVDNDTLIHLVAGGVGGTAGAIFTCPLEEHVTLCAALLIIIDADPNSVRLQVKKSTKLISKHPLKVKKIQSVVKLVLFRLVLF